MNKIFLQNFDDVVKASLLLKSSLSKYKKFDVDKDYTPDELEPYDALSIRFERLVDIIIMGLFRSCELYLFIDNSDNLRDCLLRMESKKFINDVEIWVKMRLLRNKIVHAYIPEEREKIYKDIIKYSKEIFYTIDTINEFLIIEKLI